MTIYQQRGMGEQDYIFLITNINMPCTRIPHQDLLHNSVSDKHIPPPPPPLPLWWSSMTWGGTRSAIFRQGHQFSLTASKMPPLSCTVWARMIGIRNNAGSGPVSFSRESDWSAWHHKPGAPIPLFICFTWISKSTNIKVEGIDCDQGRGKRLVRSRDSKLSNRMKSQTN